MGKQIAVVGCGVGGLAVATFLQQADHAVTIFDQFVLPAAVGSGLILQPVGQQVLARLGALDAVQHHSTQIHHMTGHDRANGIHVLNVAYDPVNGIRHGLGVHRAALFNALWQVAISAGVHVEPGHRIDRFTYQSGRGRLWTADAGLLASSFDLVIDASGAGSVLSPLRARSLTFGALWGTVDWAEDCGLAQSALSQCYRRADYMAGVLPIGMPPGARRLQAAVFWSLPRPQYDDWQGKPFDAWKDEAIKMWPEWSGFIEPLQSHDDLTFAQYAHGTLRRPFAPGIVFIGDAAHRTSPQLGQGANMALLDAAALADAIQKVGVSQAGRLYARNRRLHVWAYQTMSLMFTPLYQSSNPLMPLIRDRVLALLQSVGPMPRLLARVVCGDLVQPSSGRRKAFQNAFATRV